MERGTVDDARSHADGIEALRRGIIIGSTPLGDSQDALVARHGALDGALGGRRRRRSPRASSQQVLEADITPTLDLFS
jgi:hypothetical protein